MSICGLIAMGSYEEEYFYQHGYYPTPAQPGYNGARFYFYSDGIRLFAMLPLVGSALRRHSQWKRDAAGNVLITEL